MATIDVDVASHPTSDARCPAAVCSPRGSNVGCHLLASEAGEAGETRSAPGCVARPIAKAGFDQQLLVDQVSEFEHACRKADHQWRDQGHLDQHRAALIISEPTEDGAQ